MQEQNNQCKGVFCFKVPSSHSQIPSKNFQEQHSKQKHKMQRTPNASGGRRCALPPNPPPVFFLKLPPLTAKHLPRTTLQTKTQEQNNKRKGCFRFKVDSSHSQIPSKTNTKNKNTKQTKMKNKTTNAKNPFVLRLPLFTARYLPRTTWKTKPQEQTKKKKQQHMQRIPNASGGRRCALPPNPPPASFFFKLPPLTAKHLPRTTPQTKTQELNNKHKGFFCFKVASSHS